MLNCCVTETNDTPLLSNDLHDPGEVQERPAESIHLVDHDAVDLAGFDVRHQPIQSGPVHAAAGESTVVVVLGNADPAFVLLAGDERLGRFTLGVERIEFQLEAFFTGFAGVDRAANRRRLGLFAFAAHWSLHESKEQKAVHVGAGDRLGDRGQRPISLALVFESVGDDEHANRVSFVVTLDPVARAAAVAGHGPAAS